MSLFTDVTKFFSVLGLVCCFLKTEVAETVYFVVRILYFELYFVLILYFLFVFWSDISFCLLALRMWEVFTVKVYHGGHWVNNGHLLRYEGGDITFWERDGDKWCLFDIEDDLKELGYSNNYNMMYANPFLELSDNALNPITGDTQMLKMSEIGKEFGTVSIYVVDAEDRTKKNDDKSEKQSDRTKKNGDKGKCVVVDAAAISEDVEDEWADEDIFNADAAISEDESDELYCEVTRGLPRKRTPRGLSDNEYESDVLDTDGSDSEDDVEKPNFPRFRKMKNMSEFKWDVGTVFATKSEFRSAVIDYSVHAGIIDFSSTSFISFPFLLHCCYLFVHFICCRKGSEVREE